MYTALIHNKYNCAEHISLARGSWPSAVKLYSWHICYLLHQVNNPFHTPKNHHSDELFFRTRFYTTNDLMQKLHILVTIWAVFGNSLWQAYSYFFLLSLFSFSLLHSSTSAAQNTVIFSATATRIMILPAKVKCFRKFWLYKSISQKEIVKEFLANHGCRSKIN